MKLVMQFLFLQAGIFPRVLFLLLFIIDILLDEIRKHRNQLLLQSILKCRETWFCQTIVLNICSCQHVSEVKFYLVLSNFNISINKQLACSVANFRIFCFSMYISSNIITSAVVNGKCRLENSNYSLRPDFNSWEIFYTG